MEPAAKKRLGDIIVERGLVTADQLEEALRVQREQGGKLGEVLVELGFITRVGLAGVITEQFDTMRLTSRARKAEQAAAAAAPVVAVPAPVAAPTIPSVVETALRERLEALTAELAAKDRRIAQQDSTIAELLSRLDPRAAANAA